MPKTFFISDLHIGHKNILQYDNRPYFTCSEMAEDIVSKWNNKVTPEDTVYVVGDFFWTSDAAKMYLPKLNGKIILITGNHDNRWNNYHNKLQAVFPYLLEKIDDVWVYMAHQYTPFYLRHNKGVHIYGHSHNSQECFDEWDIQTLLKNKGYHQECYNVGCMHNYMGYEPKTIEELRDARKKGLIV